MQATRQPTVYVAEVGRISDTQAGVPLLLRDTCTTSRALRSEGASLSGQIQDGDTLLVMLQVQDEAELRCIFGALAIPLSEVTPGEATHVEINGVKAFVYVHKSDLTISVSDPSSVWSVNELAVANAKALEWIIAASVLSSGRFVTVVVLNPGHGRRLAILVASLWVKDTPKAWLKPLPYDDTHGTDQPFFL